ncbi:MAG: peptide-methionine (R)-S-oxide reductase [Methanocalculus sp. MSAO_Arc2]|uniref:peptide-methionine (R)-S-oxide reductase MsrB n=1 Tax=Methanocalculus sp. MSAO_Arc2 TaxID=2293855 RepID=UPI000FF290D4|nr:MAG: peptide-methionine (R)-S-oxide reductase [Methanocalculus sp. MSAO_Arc2]
MVRVYSVAEDAIIERKPVDKNVSEWKAVLDPETFLVTRKKGTEPPFTGRYHDCSRKGVYTCRCCRSDLFESREKFDSGTGWPSFRLPVSNLNIRIKLDRSHGMERDEVLCAVCSAHLGHVFDDGPPPGGLRFCINSAALRLKEQIL